MAIGAGTVLDPAPPLEPEQGLHLADDLPTGGLGLEQLPEEALESQAEAVDAFAAVSPLVLGGKQVDGQISSQARLQLGQGDVAESLQGAAAQRSQAGTERGEIGCMHKAVYIPPY